MLEYVITDNMRVGCNWRSRDKTSHAAPLNSHQLACDLMEKSGIFIVKPGPQLALPKYLLPNQ